jgi:polyhydroxybutyrate depolymerase
MRGRVWPVLLAIACACAAAVAGCAGSTGSARAAPVQQTISSGGAPRTFRLYVPAGLPNGKVPLMISLHGGVDSETGVTQESRTGYDAIADGAKFIVAYPYAQPDVGGDPGGTWHLGCCGKNRESKDDVTFISDVIDNLVSTANVDPDRVYATGFSVGAGMTYRLGCELSSKLAGIGSVGGYQHLSGACSPDRPVSVMEIHGTKDYWVADDVLPLNEQWRTTDGCPVTASSTVAGITTTQVWEPCKSGSGVSLVTIKDGTHCWPTPGSCGGFSASRVFWDFLSRFTRAPGAAPPAATPATPATAPGEPAAAADQQPTDAPAPAPAQEVGCVVPLLRRHTLSAARKRLSGADCAAGRVRLPRHRHSARGLVIRTQSLPAGARRPAGTRVDLLLGPAPRRRHH